MIGVRVHAEEANIKDDSRADLMELKRKLGNIAHNSKTTYETLSGLAMQSLSMIVSDEVLTKCPKESGLVEDIVSNREVQDQLRDHLGEKKFTVLLMRAQGWNLREIAEKLEVMGYVNKQGKQVTRQAVKAILADTLTTVKKMKNFKNL